MEKFWTILAVFNYIMLVLCVITGAEDAFNTFLIATFGCAIIAEIEINSKKEE